MIRILGFIIIVVSSVKIGFDISGKYTGRVKELKSFIKVLEKYRINVTVRRTLGSDINASCGQLRRGEGPK